MQHTYVRTNTHAESEILVTILKKLVRRSKCSYKYISEGASNLRAAEVYISVRKRYWPPPPPFWKWYSPPPRDIRFSTSTPFCLNSSLFCNYFILLLLLFSFSFPFLPFSCPFSPFLFTFSYFSPKWHWLIFPVPPGGQVFSKKMTSNCCLSIDRWLQNERWLQKWNTTETWYLKLNKENSCKED